jgi:hypothetical protein
MPTLIVAESVVGGISLNVTDLLKARQQIPPYQRDYVWTKRTVEDLWDDLISHYKKFSVGDKLLNPEGYFLGAMVVIGGQQSQTTEVVDGQQRLTSLSTIMTVLLDAMREYGIPEPYRSGYEQVARECLGRFVGGKYETNLSFSDQEVASFFLDSCLTYTSHSDKATYWSTPWCSTKLARKNSTIYRIREAIACGYDRLNAFLNEGGLTGSQQQDRLISFFQLVSECVVVLRITAHSHSNAYAIFESLNNRGIRLSQADLIKNELLKVASSNELDDIIDDWTSARQNVDSSEVISLPEFLHYSYLSRYGKVKANDLFENVKTLLASGAGVARRYSQELSTDAAALDALTSNFDATWTDDTHHMLKDIMNVLGVKLCYPFLIAAYRRHSTNKADFQSHVRLVMNFAFRHLKVMDGSIESLAGAIGEASHRINQGRPLSEVAVPFRTLAPDSLFQQKFEDAAFSNTKLAYFTVYYLEKIRLQGALPVSHGHEQNLEHIMPRTPSVAHWPAILAEKNANPELFKEFLWRVGNLLPLPEAINKSIKNKGIHHKISNGSGNEYSSPALSLASPKDVVNYLDGNDWTYKSIENRQRDLAQTYAALAWPL